jgi:peptidoglycan/LPS O-acetylase OafA/YrhL
LGLPLIVATGLAVLAVIALAHILHIGVENPSQRFLRDVRRTRSLSAD